VPVIEKLPPRERELFEALYGLKEATAAELQAALDDPPSNSAVRIMLRRLEEKGFVTHREEQGRYVYAPAVPENRMKQSAVRRLVEVYFGGSPLGAATALVGMSDKVDEEELRQLEAMIARVRKEDKR
jgi:predicted transcriptional regulator